jgi:hypothetical protein
MNILYSAAMVTERARVMATGPLVIGTGPWHFTLGPAPWRVPIQCRSGAVVVMVSGCSARLMRNAWLAATPWMNAVTV